MLSEAEKQTVDRLAFCVHLTRSGLLANVVTQFVAATENNKAGRAAETSLLAYLKECRAAVTKRGGFADKTLAPQTEKQ